MGKVIEAVHRMVAAGTRECEKMRKWSRDANFQFCKMNSSGDLMYRKATVINNTLLCA